MRKDQRSLSARRIAAAVLLLCEVQFFVAEAVTAAAWSLVPYSYRDNYISDLGLPECVVLDRTVCSPAHLLMDASFIAQGVLVLLVCWLLRDIRRVVKGGARPAWTVMVVLAVVHAVGLILVGSFPGSYAEEFGGDPRRMLLHSIGALLAIGGGNLLLVAGVAMAAAGRRIALALATGVLAVVGLGAMIAGFAGSDLGLGVGGSERFAAYPVIVWLILGGVWVLRHRRDVAPLDD